MVESNEMVTKRDRVIYDQILAGSKTYEQIGKEHGISKSRIGQIALRTFRLFREERERDGQEE